MFPFCSNAIGADHTTSIVVAFSDSTDISRDAPAATKEISLA